MLKNITLICKTNKINWAILPSLPDKLRAIGFNDFDKPSIRIWQHPHEWTYDDYSDICEHVKKLGVPQKFAINVYEQYDPEKNNRKHFCLSSIGKYGENELVTISLEEHNSTEDLKTIADFFDCEPDEIVEKPAISLDCFIAHRFSKEGDELATKLTRYLKLLGLKISSGRSFTPGSVSEKVKERLADCSIVFAILTHGDDKTWLVQESLLASLSGKPLFLIKEESYTHNAGFLSDHEYIPFTNPNIEMAFIPILEGLRDIGLRLK